MRAIDRLLRNRPTAGGMSLAGKIRALFSNGEQGWWYDPSNFATLFQDSAGTTPVTAVEQPVGLQLDLSKGLVLGSELVTNGGPFVNTTGWATTGTALTASGGTLNATCTGASDGLIYGAWNTPNSGLNYLQMSVTITAITGRVRLKIYGSNVVGDWITSPGTYQVRLYQTNANGNIGLNTDQTSSISISSFSAKQVAGNHRFQSTSANRPVVSARVNLLTKTEQFDDAAWGKSGAGTGLTAVVTNNYADAPDGSMTATRVLLDVQAGRSGSDFSRIIHEISAGAVSFRVWLKSNTTSSYAIELWISSFVQQITVTPVWQEFEVSRSGGNVNAQIIYFGNDAVTNQADLLVWHPDVRSTTQGVGLPAYQRVNTSTDYDSTGFPVYIKPNGSNQFMVTNSINFSATDKMTVWQGVRKLSDASTAALMELSSSWVANAGSFVFLAPDGVGTFVSGSRGTATPALNQTATASPYAAPITDVLFSSHDIAADLTTLRVNTVAATSATGDKGTGNYGTYPAYFYMRAGTSLPFNGNDYGSIARGAASTAAQITAGETYINKLTKAY